MEIFKFVILLLFQVMVLLLLRVDLQEYVGKENDENCKNNAAFDVVFEKATNNTNAKICLSDQSHNVAAVEQHPTNDSIIQLDVSKRWPREVWLEIGQNCS